MNQRRKGVLIRDFKKSDLDDVLKIAEKSFVEEFEISGFDPDHMREMVDKAFSFWGKILLGFLKLLGKEPFRLFVAEADGRVVGTTMVSIKDKIGHVTGVMVHPIHRKKGIATKLMKSALGYIQKKKSSRAILHVMSRNTAAEGLYHKLGFKKFETTMYLVANIDSLRKPSNVEGVFVRNFKKKDIEAVYNLLRVSEDPVHLEVFDFKRKNLEIPLIERLFPLSAEKKVVATKNGVIVGYAEASYTTAEEAGRIENIQVHPDMQSKGIEGVLIEDGVNYIKKIGTNKVIATTLSTKRELVEKMYQLGFAKSLEMEGMVLSLANPFSPLSSL